MKKSRRGQREPPRSSDDLALVRGVLEGESTAVEEFVDRMRCVSRILSYQNERLGKPLSATELLDIGQETILAVWKKLSQYSGEVRLQSWVFRFCYLEMLARLRKLQRLPRLFEDLDDNPLEGLSVPASDPFRFASIHRGIEKLQSNHREVILLKHFRGLTFEEAAAHLGVSSNTAKTRYYRAIDLLRDFLEEGKSEERVSQHRREFDG